MALGGGTFTAQNKVLPGAYINVVSAQKATLALSERGIATMGLNMDWGPESQIITIQAEDVVGDSLKIFGYDYTADAMKPVRELFNAIKTLYAYRLTSGGVKASNTFATAKYCGTKGNDIKTVIAKNVDDNTKYDVSTYFGTRLIDTQTVTAATALVDNDYVTFITTSTLAVTAGLSMTGGTNGTPSGTTHQDYLDKAESYSFNAMGLDSDDETTKKLYIAYTKRMRNEVGLKFQLVLYNYVAADSESTVSVKNQQNLVYWVTSNIAGCAINKSLTNRNYDGEYAVTAPYTQAQLSAAIKEGSFTFHKVGEEIHVLKDIDSLTTLTTDKNELFQDNQTIRIMDQIATDIAVLFNTKYLGNVQNNAAGRIGLWTDIVKEHQTLQNMGALEGFEDADVVISAGETKGAVVVSDAVTTVGTMDKLYMTVTVQ